MTETPTPVPAQQRDRVHELKTTPEPFQATLLGLKPFELRRNDRDFRRGDLLILREWDANAAADCDDVEAGYSGRKIRARVSYVLEGAMPEVAYEEPPTPTWAAESLREGWVVLGLNVFTITGQRTAVGSVTQAHEYAVPQVQVEGEAAR